MTPIRRLSLVRLPDGATSALGPPPPDRFQRYDHALAHSAERRVDTPTPTVNTDLVFRRGGFASLCDALDYAAHGETGFNFFDARGKLLSRLPYRDLRGPGPGLRPPPDRRGRRARRTPGAGRRHLAGLLRWPSSARSMPASCPCRSAVPVGLGAQGRAIIDQLRRQIAASGAVGGLALDELAGLRRTAPPRAPRPRLPAAMSAFEALPEISRSICGRFGAGELCYIQFSSGSTRQPRGIDIRQDAADGQYRRLAGRPQDVVPDDRA